MNQILSSMNSNPFFGRENDIQTIIKYLKTKDCRIITLLGLGGIGKTRLAYEIIHRTDGYFERNYFVSLQAITSEQGLITTLANQLNIQLFENLPLLSQVIDWIHERRILIVFDNFEHLLDAKKVVLRLVLETEYTKFLVTSRQALQLQLEYLHQLTGLDTQSGQNASAVKMFAAYASRANSTFNPQKEVSDIIRVCQVVDGMPLAIQLASSWVKSISCRTIAEAIDKNYQNLKSEYTDLPSRHRNIQACFEYSWNMLEPAEQQKFARLSIFKGGWTLQSAQVIVEADIWMLRSLTDKSFIQYNSQTGRYTCHELLRQFGQQKLSQNAYDKNITTQRYIDYFAQQAHNLIQDFKRKTYRKAHLFFTNEQFNLIAVWQLAINHHDEDVLSQLWEGFYLFFTQTSNYLEGQEIFQMLIDAPEIFSKDLQLIGHTIALWLMMRTGEVNVSRMRFESASALVQDIYNPKTRAESLFLIHYTSNRIIAGEYHEVSELTKRSIEIAQKIDDSYYISFALYNYGRLLHRIGAVEDATNYLQKSIDVSERIGLRWGTGFTLIELSVVLEKLGQHKEALSILTESYAIFKDIGDYSGMVFSLSYASRILLYQEQTHRAYDYLQQAFDIALESENLTPLVGVVLDTAFYLQAIKKTVLATKLARYVVSHPATYSLERGRAEELLKQLELNIDESVYKNATIEGENLTNTQVTDSLHEVFAVVPTNEGRHPHDTLTPREEEVLHLIATPMTTQEIAEQLFIAKGTLRIHLKRIYGKLDAHSRIEAVANAKNLNLL